MSENEFPELDPRLLSAVSFVRQGGVACDVGTDHAYLPIYALLTGRCDRAVASDVNAGPLRRARENARRWGVEDRLLCIRADGLDGVNPEQNEITDIVICGMGGELIARIIDEAEYTRKSGVRLILQPMTMGRELRRYLLSHGFAILDEALSRAAGKVYACLCVAYGGGAEAYSEVELLLGRKNIERKEALFGELAEKEVAKLEKRIEGLRRGGYDAAAEQALLDQIQRIM